jgi:hypothetical protein
VSVHTVRIKKRPSQCNGTFDSSSAAPWMTLLRVCNNFVWFGLRATTRFAVVFVHGSFQKKSKKNAKHTACAQRTNWEGGVKETRNLKIREWKKC